MTGGSDTNIEIDEGSLLKWSKSVDGFLEASRVCELVEQVTKSHEFELACYVVDQINDPHRPLLNAIILDEYFQHHTIDFQPDQEYGMSMIPSNGKAMPYAEPMYIEYPLDIFVDSAMEEIDQYLKEPAESRHGPDKDDVQPGYIQVHQMAAEAAKEGRYASCQYMLSHAPPAIKTGMIQLFTISKLYTEFKALRSTMETVYRFPHNHDVHWEVAGDADVEELKQCLLDIQFRTRDFRERRYRLLGQIGNHALMATSPFETQEMLRIFGKSTLASDADRTELIRERIQFNTSLYER